MLKNLFLITSTLAALRLRLAVTPRMQREARLKRQVLNSKPLSKE